MAADHTHDKRGIACNHVVRRKRPVMLVAHDADGLVQFMCGKDDHSKAKQAKKVCAACSFQNLTPGLAAEDLEPGQIAERQSKTVWTVRALSEEENGQIEA